MSNPIIDQEPIWIASSEKRYECLEILGEGGMGRVFKAYDHRLQRNVAIKLLKSDEKSVSLESQILFIKEAQTTAQLNHSYIIPVYDAGYWEGKGFYLVMKEVQGKSLDHLIKAFHQNADGWYNPNEKIKLLSAQTWVDFCVILRQVAQAIGFAHKQGALHRDLKPENIMIGQDGEVWVLDWGLARSSQSAQINVVPSISTPVINAPTILPQTIVAQNNDLSFSDTFVAEPTPTQVGYPKNPSRSSLAQNLTFTGIVSGTPAYMSPEQAKALPLDPRCDTYALGAILYEILANRAPYVGNNPYQILAQVLQEDPPSLDAEILIEQTPLLKTAPNSLKKLCIKALSRDIDQRFADGTAFAEALKEIERGADLYERAQQAFQEGLLLSSQIKQAKEQLTQINLKIEKYKNQRNSQIGLYWGQKLKLEQQIQADEIREMAEYERAVLICPDHHQALFTFIEKLMGQFKEIFYENRQSAQLAKIEKQLLELKKQLPYQHEMVDCIDQLLKKQKKLELRFIPHDAHLKLIFVDQPMQAFAYEQNKPIFKYEWQCQELHQYDFKIGSYQYEIEYQGLSFMGSFENKPMGLSQNQTFKYPQHIPQGPKLCFIPQGSFRYGSTQGIINEVSPQVLDIPAFWIMERPVSYQLYCDFLNDVLENHGEAIADQYIPIARMTINFGAKAYELVGQKYQINEKYRSHYHQLINVEPDILGVNFLNFFHAQAFAAYLRRKTNRLWRLPYEWEYEKAARGVDGRLFPWPQILNKPEEQDLRDHQQLSPYGLISTVGLISTWCLNYKKNPYPADEVFSQKSWLIEQIQENDQISGGPAQIESQDFAIRGGGYFNEGLTRSIPYRFAAAPKRTFADVGIRLVCEAEDQDF